jgi:hypothetical protein
MTLTPGPSSSIERPAIRPPHDRMSMCLLAWPVPEPSYLIARICASGEARTAITWHSSPELWLMA